MGEFALGQGPLRDCQVAVVNQLKIRSFARPQAKSRVGQPLAEQIALALIKIAEVEIRLRVCHVRRKAMLHRRVYRERIELVDFSEFGHQFGRRRAVGNFPSGDVVGLPKR